MIRIYKINKENFKEAKKILEADPYEKDSFPSVGYKLREGKEIGEFDGYYVYVSANEEVIEKLDKRIEGKATILEGEEFEEVKKKIEEEEESAQQGFGNLFG